jgi:hypothetical protein
MKKIIYASLFLFSMSLCAVAQNEKDAVTKEKPTAPANPNAAEINFETEVHDFGTLPYAGDGSYDFKFTNVGKDPLVISNARGSCGCTVPSWPKEPILKGHTGMIHVQYDTKRPGPFTKTVTISSNAKTAEKVITIKGNIESKEQTENGTPVKKDNSMAPKESTANPFGN